VIERTGSDNTSTSVSIEKSVVVTQRTQQSKPFTSNLYTTPARQTVTSTRSWSDDTITAPPRPTQSIIKKSVSPDDTWNSSHSDEDFDARKPKSALSTLQKTLPFAPSTNYGIDRDSDDDSPETEIRKLDTHKPVVGSTVQALVNKQVGNGYKVVGVNEVQSPVSDESSWTTSAPVHKEPINRGVQNLIQKPDESSWTTSALLHKEPTNRGVQNLIQKPDDSTWDDSRPLSVDLNDKQTLKSVSNLVVHQPALPQAGTTGVENLTKMMASIMQRPKLS
jgi:hypothetical protein